MPGGGSEAIILPALMGGTEAVTAAGIPAFLSAAVDAAALGAAGSALMGQDPLKGALFGGLTGGALKAIAPQGLGALFGGGINPDVGETAGAITQGASQFQNAPGVNIGKLDTIYNPASAVSGAANSVTSQMSSALAPSSVASSAAKGFWDSKLGQFVPYAALGLGATALDRAMAPEQVGPSLKPQKESKPVQALSREYQDVDPSVYMTSGGNRSFYKPYGMQPTYYADGGQAKPVDEFFAMRANKYSNGGSSSASSSNTPPMSRKVKGRGDGMNDKIPAMLSDGEFVISAPVVSALGNGSNDAGARKLDGLQKKVLARHYGGKAKKSMGLGALA